MVAKLDKLRSALRKVLFPPIWFRWVFALASFAFVGGVLFSGKNFEPCAYAAYGASALGLYYVVATLAPAARDAALRVIMSHSLTRRYYTDAQLRSRVSLYWGAGLNVAYSLFNLVSGIWFGSTWLIAIGVYYLALIAVKSAIVVEDVKQLRGTHEGMLTAWMAHRRAGWLMLLMNVGLMGITAHVTATGASFEYPGFLIFAIAAWAFYYIINAIVRIVRARNEDDPVYDASRAVDLSFAATSMFTLQTAMFASFNKGADAMDTFMPNVITSSLVAVFITAIAISMIVRATMHVRAIRKGSEA